MGFGALGFDKIINAKLDNEGKVRDDLNPGLMQPNKE
jgi:hypothetical protein